MRPVELRRDLGLGLLAVRDLESRLLLLRGRLEVDGTLALEERLSA